MWYAGIKELIQNQNLIVDKICKGEYHHRHGLSVIDLDADVNFVQGVRGAGKTTAIVRKLKDSGKRFAYIDVSESVQNGLDRIPASAIIEILTCVYGQFDVVIIDEVVKYPSWEILIGSFRELGIKVVAINSGEIPENCLNAKTTDMFTLSFSEYCIWHGIDYDSQSPVSRGIAAAAFEDFLKRGGFPADQSRKYHRRSTDPVISKIMERDMPNDLRAAKIPEIKRLACNLVRDTPMSMDYKESLHHYEVASVNTLRKYVESIKRTCLLVRLARLSLFDKVRNYREKLYAADVSLVSAENIVARVETAVYIQLLRAAQRHGYFVHYYSSRELACSFAVCKDMRMRVLIQIMPEEESEAMLKEKIAGMVSLSRETGCKRMFILSDGQSSVINTKGMEVTMVPVYEFLLDKYHLL